MKKIPYLKIKHRGEVDATIMWVEGPLLKIKFFDSDENQIIREVFHHSEIENFNDIFIDKNLNISSLIDEE